MKYLNTMTETGIGMEIMIGMMIEIGLGMGVGKGIKIWIVNGELN